MTSIRKVLFPVDFSQRCAGAARYVEAFGRLFRPSIDMVHVLPPPHYESISLEVSGPALAEVLAGRKEFAEKQLEGFLAGELKPFAVTRVLLEGDPAGQVVRHARETGASLIVLPTHGYGPFRRFILGSVAAKVLHDSDVPVLTGVHLEEAPPLEAIRFERIVAAVDLRAGSERVLEWAACFARATGAKLIVVHALPSLEGQTGPYFDPAWRESLSAEVTPKLDDMIAQLPVKAERMLVFGDSSKQVCEVAQAEGAGLLVIGREHQHEGLGRLNTHAYSIIRMSPCPVVSV